MAPTHGAGWLAALAGLLAGLASAVAGQANVYQCALSCVNRTFFETNIDPYRWAGPPAGTISFCNAYFGPTYVFCPRVWVYNSSLSYNIADMDAFAQAYYTTLLGVHNANCNSNAPFNTCSRCLSPLMAYACVYAFQPCYNTSSTDLEPVCSDTCTNVANNCQLSPDCSTGNATGMVIDASGDGKCYEASGAPAIAVQLAALVATAVITLLVSL